MSATQNNQVMLPGRTLRRLFLMLFLRGRSSRGLRKDKAPKSIGRRLGFALLFYGLFGLVALSCIGQPIFALSLFSHGMTLVFLGMFIASSAGEVLFNKEEADILLHRPVTPQAMLWAKIAVLVQVSLWLAIALNLAGIVVGVFAPDGGWLFPPAHILSTALQALFCTGFIVLTYQLCLRWFGRERLEGLMTTVQIFAAIAAVVGGQIVPQLLTRFGTKIHLSAAAWWLVLLPPAWFAGLDNALAGGGGVNSWLLAAIGGLATAVVLWLAFGKLAHSYESGLQALSEATPARPKRQGRHWLGWLVITPPLRWWLRNSVSRGAFLLTAAYLFRDRETKLRIYPGLAPMMIMPVIFLIRGGMTRDYAVAFSGTYLGIVPLVGISLLRYSQQWQASDLFRMAPVKGPGLISHGTRRAAMVFLALPALILFAVIAWFAQRDFEHILLLLPGIIAVPVFALIPCLSGKGVPFSFPGEEAKSARQGLRMLTVTFISFPLAGLTTWSWSGGWFWWLVLVESIVALGMYLVLRHRINECPWDLME
jgi:ABC-2 type transport system permease protein